MADGGGGSKISLPQCCSFPCCCEVSSQSPTSVRSLMGSSSLLAVFREMVKYCQASPQIQLSGEEADSAEERAVKWLGSGEGSPMEYFLEKDYYGFAFDRLLMECIACFRHSVVDVWGVEHRILPCFSKWLAEVQMGAAESLIQVPSHSELAHLDLVRLLGSKSPSYEQAVLGLRPPNYEVIRTSKRRPVVDVYRALLMRSQAADELPDDVTEPFRDGRFREAFDCNHITPYTRWCSRLRDNKTRNPYLRFMIGLDALRRRLWSGIYGRGGIKAPHESDCSCLKCLRPRPESNSKREKLEDLTRELCATHKCPGAFRMYGHLMVLFTDIICENECVHPKYKRLCRSLKKVILARLDPRVANITVLDAVEKLAEIRQWDDSKDDESEDDDLRDDESEDDDLRDDESEDDDSRDDESEDDDSRRQ